MHIAVIESLSRHKRAVDEMSAVRVNGRVTRVVGLVMEDLGPGSSVGEFCHVFPKDGGEPIQCEVVGFSDDKILLMPLGETHGIHPGSEVVALGAPLQVSVSDSIKGRVIDGLGHPLATALGAVALGARVIEKHFTDDNNRVGPDHKFAMNPQTWADMVENTRQLERALGSPDKFVAGNEQDTVVLQRRCLRAARDIRAGETFTRGMIDVLRPASQGAILPYQIEEVIGTRALQTSLPVRNCAGQTSARERAVSRILYFTRDYTTHDHRFLSAMAKAGIQVYYLRLERQSQAFEDRPLPPEVEQVQWAGGQKTARWQDGPRLLRPRSGSC